MLKRLIELLKDAAIYGSANLLQKLAGFLLIPLYTRFLRPEDYGVIAMLALVQTVMEILMHLGMKSAVFREFSLADDDAKRRRVVSVGVVCVAATATGWVVASLFFDRWLTGLLLEPGSDVMLIRVTMVTAAFSVVSDIPLLAFQANRQARLVSAVTFVRMLGTVLLTIVMVVFLDKSVWGVVNAMLISTVIAAIVLVVMMLKRFGWEFDRKLLSSMQRYGAPFVPYRLQDAALMVFGDYVVRHMLGLGEVGLYSVASRFALPVSFVVQAINQAWWPYKFHIFKSEQDPEPVFRSITTYYVAALSYLWVGVSIWGPELLRFMTPGEFHAAMILIPMLALNRMLQGVFQMVSTGIELAKSARPITFVATPALIVAIPSAIYMVPRFGALGAAVASCLGTVTMTIAAYFLAQSRVRIRYDLATMGGLAALSVAIVFVGHSVADASLWTRAAWYVALSSLYPALAFMLLFWSKSERARIRQLANLFPTLWRKRKAV